MHRSRSIERNKERECCGLYSNKHYLPLWSSKIIITDNRRPFCNSLMNKLCEKFDFKQHNSSMYYALANGLAEAFNKTLCKLLQKVGDKSKRD